MLYTWAAAHQRKEGEGKRRTTAHRQSHGACVGAARKVCPSLEQRDRKTQKENRAFPSQLWSTVFTMAALNVCTDFIA